MRSLGVTAALAALLLPALASAEGPDAAAPAPGDGRRGRWYLAAGIGSGGAELTTMGDTLDPRELNLGRAPATLTLDLQGGWVLTRTVKVGLDLSLFRSWSDRDGIHTAFQVFTAGPLVTWSPWETGPFVRAGAGLSTLDWDQDSFGAFRRTGLSGGAGLGWAFPVGRGVSLVAALDASLQAYGSSRVGRDAATTWWLSAGAAWE